MHILITSEPDAYAGRVSPISTSGVGRGEWGMLALYTHHDTPSHARPTHRSVPPTSRPPTTLSSPLLTHPPTSPPPQRHQQVIFGKLTSRSMQRVEDAMISQCGLGKDSVFIDGGAGLGKHPGGPVPRHSDLLRHRVRGLDSAIIDHNEFDAICDH